MTSLRYLTQVLRHLCIEVFSWKTTSHTCKNNTLKKLEHKQIVLWLSVLSGSPISTNLFSISALNVPNFQVVIISWARTWLFIIVIVRTINIPWCSYTELSTECLTGIFGLSWNMAMVHDFWILSIIFLMTTNYIAPRTSMKECFFLQSQFQFYS